MKKLGLLEEERFLFIVNDYSYSSSVFVSENKPYTQNELLCSGKLVWDIEDEQEIGDLFSGREIDITLKEMRGGYNLEAKFTFGVFVFNDDCIDLRLGVSNKVINNILSVNNAFDGKKIPFYLYITIPKSNSWKEGENTEIHEFRISIPGGSVSDREENDKDYSDDETEKQDSHELILLEKVLKNQKLVSEVFLMLKAVFVVLVIVLVLIIR